MRHLTKFSHWASVDSPDPLPTGSLQLYNSISFMFHVHKALLWQYTDQSHLLKQTSDFTSHMNLESCWTPGALGAGDVQVYLEPPSLMPTCLETPFLLAGPPWVWLLDRFSGCHAGMNILPAFYNRAGVLGSAPARGWLLAILGPWSFQTLNPSAIHRITPE